MKIAPAPDCSLQNNKSAPDDVEAAWNRFQTAVKALETSFQKSPYYQTDKLGAYTLLQYFVQDAMGAMAEAADGLYPHFVTNVDPDKRMGIDNPDTFYRRAFVQNENGKQIYTIKGTRGNKRMRTSHFSVQLVSQTETEQEKIEPLEGYNMDFGTTGEFEVTLSAKKPDYSEDIPSYKKNWVELPIGFRGGALVRDTFCDWETEVAGSVNIQRNCSEGQRANLQTLESTVTRINMATDMLIGQGFFWGIGLQIRKFKAEETKIPTNHFSEWQTTPNGLTTQHFSQTHFALKKDQAIIITAKATDAPYHGLQITDVWGVSPVDWSRRQTSLSWGKEESQAYPSKATKDGLLYHFVLSAKDPEVENWIDTAGLSRGMITLRLQGKETAISEEEKKYPKLEVVEFDKVKQSLPDGTPAFGQLDRQEQLRRRQAHIQRRFINW